MWKDKKHGDRLTDPSFASERLLLLCLLGVLGGGEGGKAITATFTARVGCRCIDRVVIMVQWGLFSWGSLVDKFYGGGGQVTKEAGVGLGLLS